MSRFGWAYVSDIVTGSGGTPGGSDKAIQFASGSTFSGSTNFTFDYNTSTVRLTGTLYADNLIVSSSTIYKSGSTKFGDDTGDTHEFTGSVYVNGIVSSSLRVEGYNLRANVGDIVATSGAVSASLSVNTAGTISAGSNITTTGGVISSSLGFLTSGSVQSVGNITSTAGTVSASLGVNTAGTINAGSHISSTGNISSSTGLYSGDVLNVRGVSNLKNDLVVTGTIYVSGNVESNNMIITTNGFSGSGFSITDVQGYNVDGVGDDGSLQFKSPLTGKITGSSNLTFSGSTLTLTGTFNVTGGVAVSPYLQLLPVGNVIVPTNQTASYIYTSGSTNDMYFTQYQPGSGFNNTTRLRWLEGSLSSGLLHGGILSTVTGTTSFNLSSGSGIVVTYNASTTSDPYPTIKYVTWSNFVSQSLIYSASSAITYIAIDDNGAISQTNVAFTSAQFKDRIIIGRVLHQSGAVTNGVITTPTTAYGINSNTQDFFRAFGPLKVSGQILAASGTTTLAITRSAGDSYVEGRNYSSNPNVPNYVLAVDDAALTTAKIFYEWVSGSSVNIDNNGGIGYTELIPNKYNLNGTITTISPTNNKFTIQRVYWFPKSVTRALYVYYGSTIYSSLSDAVAAISDEPNFTEGDNTRASAVYLGSVILEAGISNFTDTTKSKIVNGGLFRATSNGGGGGSATVSPGGSNHQIQFNDSGVFNGSANLTFDTTTLRLTGSFAMIGTGSLDIDGGYITGSGVLSMGTISGSTITGSTALLSTITASVVTGSTALFTSLTGNLFGTSSYATNAGNSVTVTNGIYTNANNTFTGINTFNTNYVTASITGSDAKFTTITGSTITGSVGQFAALTSSNIVVVSGTINSRGIPNVLPTSIRRTIQVFPGAGSMVNSMNPINNANDTPFTQGGTPTQGFVNGSAVIAYSVVSSTTTYGITTPDVGSTKVLCTSQRGPSWRGTFRTGNDLTQTRIFAGFEEYAGDKSVDDPTNGYAHLSYSSVRGDTTFKMITRTANGVGTQAILDTGISASVSTNYYFDMTLSSGSYNVTLVSGSSTFAGSITSSLPNITASLGTCCAAKNTAAVSRNLSIYFLEFNDS